MPDASTSPPLLSGPARLRGLLTSREFLYLVVGGANTVFSLAVFTLLHALLGSTLGYLGVLVLTYAVGILVSFVTQRLLVFRVRGRVLVDFVVFASVQIGAFLLNALLLSLLVELTPIPVVPAQVLALGVVVVLTYFLHATLSFSPRGRDVPQD